ncbi:MAG: hypothetical protein VB131_00150 [Burkholderia gladioli]
MTGDEVLTALSALGEDPSASRVERVLEFIDHVTLSADDREKVVCRAVDMARRRLDLVSQRATLPYPNHWPFPPDFRLDQMKTQELDLSNIDLDAKVLTDCGYRRVSRKYCILARIDRPNWTEWLVENTHHTRETIDRMVSSDKFGHLQSYYANVGSRDHIVVSKDISEQVPASGRDAVGYVQVTTKIEWRGEVRGDHQMEALLRELGISFEAYDSGYYLGCEADSVQLRTLRERGHLALFEPVRATFTVDRPTDVLDEVVTSASSPANHE